MSHAAGFGVFVGVNHANDAEDEGQEGQDAAQAVNNHQRDQPHKPAIHGVVHDQSEAAQDGDQAGHAAVVTDQGGDVAIGDQSRVGFVLVASGGAARTIVLVVL